MVDETDLFSKRPLSQETYDVIAVIYALLALLAFVFNGLAIFTFFRDHSLLLPSNLLILSISVADWLMAVVANPIGVAANASQAWSLNDRSCVVYAFTTTLLGFAAMIHHTVMAVERCMVVTRPYMEEIPNKIMIAIISSIWAFSLLWSLFPLFGWSAYVPESGNTACSIRWQSSDEKDTFYIYAIFTCFFFVPIVVIISAYSLMYRSVKRMSMNAVRMWGATAGPTLQIMKSRAKSAKMFLVMVMGFVIGWTPYAVVSLYAVAGQASAISPWIATVPAMFAKTTIVYNPIIYFFMYNRFKRSLNNSLRKVFKRSAVDPTSPNESNQSGFPYIRDRNIPLNVQND